MRYLNECEFCHALDREPDRLCRPRVATGACRTPLSLSENLERMCAPTRSAVDFACASCGRPALDGAMICEPRLLRG